MISPKPQSTVLRALMCAAAAASLAACASHPKPTPLAPTTPVPEQAPDSNAAPTPQPVETGRPKPGTEQDFVINVGDRVYFDFDAYNVRSDALPILDGQAAWLNRYPAVKVRIEGNCDERGTREYNLALGARRATSVRDYLVNHGVAASRIVTVSYGKERPLDGGTGESAYAHNRNAHTAITEGARP